MVKVKCRVCANEEDSFCTIKKGNKLKLNKPRKCKNFIFTTEKVNVKVKPVSVLRPEWYWNRKKFFKEYEKQLTAEVKAPTEKVNSNLINPDCLANFRSTVNKNDERND